MKRSDILGLPSWRPGAAYLYAVVAESGLVKVGSTKNPRGRICGLFDQLRRTHSTAMVGAFVAELKRGRQFEAERRLVARCAEQTAPSKGREWFDELDFHEAIRLVSSEATA
jgi:hypothetical protein